MPKPDGSHDSERCIAGAHPAGVPVLLLSRDGARTCAFRTTRQVDRLVGDGPCTLIAETGSCPERAFAGIVVVGSLPTGYGLTRIDRVKDLGALSKVITARGLVRGLVEKSGEWHGPSAPGAVESEPAEAFVLSGIGRSPVFVRYRMRLTPGSALQNGPIVVVDRAGASAPFESVCVSTPTGFTLGGIDYVHASWGCCDCGVQKDQIYAVENGKLRLVLSTMDLSN